MHGRLTIVSDGTMWGTRVLTEEGVLVEGVTKIELTPITNKTGFVTAKLTMEVMLDLRDIEINIVTGEEET